ncbi:hypothetical protein J5X84_39560 [Streptosporangiaceae bacterium NEAU-GS5]|nr:hypothetical protein [Streptosporangiaceae bacterium NEAU-GS5]
MITRIVSTLVAAVVTFGSPGLPAKAVPAGVAAETRAGHALIVEMPHGIAYGPTATPAENGARTEQRRRRVLHPDP